MKSTLASFSIFVVLVVCSSAGGQALSKCFRADWLQGERSINLTITGSKVAAADCTAVPVKPQVKAGDKVKAMAFGSFDDFTVVSVDEKLGKVVVKQEGKTEQRSIKFGDVMNP